MILKRVITVAIAFALLSVSFAMTGNVRNFFVDNASAQWSDWDNSTTLTVNAVFPKLYWIGFNQTAGAVPPWPASRLDTQSVPNADYSFCFEYNYSLGWNNCDFLVQAWYDNGLVQVASQFPVSPTNAQRTTAFNISCDSTGNAAIFDHPLPALEVTTGPAQVILHKVFIHPTTLLPDPLQDTYRVYIPVHLGPQIRAALGATTGTGYNRLKTIALDDANTWDFSITVRDLGSTASNTSYAEFGIQELVSVLASGNPTGNAPPGGSCICAPYSNIVYSANTPYFVNVSLETALELNGVPSANDIPVTQVSVQNMHPNAALGSQIAGVTPFVAIEPARLYVWGQNMVAIPAPGNGTVAAGPLMSDYWGGTASTDLEWRVSVPAGRPEGIYWATIIISIEDF